MPIIALTSQMAKLEFLSVSAAYPLFLYFWGTCEEWYFLLPVAINSCLMALALNRILKLKSSRLSSKIRNKVKYSSIILVAILFIYSFHCEVESTRSFIQTAHGHDLQEVTDFLKTQFYNQDITMIDCFWAYSLYPLGEFMHIRYECYSDQESFESLQWKIGQVGLCILGKTDATINLMLQESFKGSVVFENILFTIIHTTT